MAEYIIEFDIFNREESRKEVERFRTEKFRVYSDNDKSAAGKAYGYLNRCISENEYVDETRIMRVINRRDTLCLPYED